VTLTTGGFGADQLSMGRGVIAMCASFGMLLGGFVPDLWGAGQLSMQSILFSAFGGIAGVWAGVRIAE
jgi:hypothetical protein